MVQAIKELKQNFKVVHNVKCDTHVKCFNKNKYEPKKVQSPLANVVVYDLEGLNKIGAVRYCSCIHKLSKLSGIYHRDKSEKKYQECLNNSVAFKGTYCNNDMLDHVFMFKGESIKIKNKIVEYNLFLIAHNGSGCDSYVVLNNLPQWSSVYNLIKNGASNIPLKTFDAYVDENKNFLNTFILNVVEFILIVVWKK